MNSLKIKAQSSERTKMVNQKEKMVIYAVLPRLFGNGNIGRIVNGSITENGCGKMADFDGKA